jgi:hypothetical protein
VKISINCLSIRCFFFFFRPSQQQQQQQQHLPPILPSALTRLVQQHPLLPYPITAGVENSLFFGGLAQHQQQYQQYQQYQQQQQFSLLYGGGGLFDMDRGGIANGGLAPPQHQPASVVGTRNLSLTMSSAANPGIHTVGGFASNNLGGNSNTNSNRMIVPVLTNPTLAQQLQENQQRQRQLQQQQQQQSRKPQP